MQTAQCDVSVIIVSWNVSSMLRDCLASIYEQSRNIDVEVIVVDNASSDDSVAMVRQEFPQVVLVASDKNLGFASANNVGLAKARGRYLLLLNPDTIILDDAIGKSLQWLNAHPDVGVMGCQVYVDEHTIQRTCFAHPSPVNLVLDMAGFTSRFRNSSLLGRAALGGWDRESQRDVPVVSGMFMLIPRRALDEVGLMDDRFFVYSEEADLCRRLWSAGWRCVFAPVARIIHRDGGGKSTHQFSVKMYVQLQKSQLLYCYKHYGIPGGLLVWLIYLVAMGLRAVAHGFLGFVLGRKQSQHRALQSWSALKFHLLGIDPCPPSQKVALS